MGTFLIQNLIQQDIYPFQHVFRIHLESSFKTAIIKDLSNDDTGIFRMIFPEFIQFHNNIVIFIVFEC